MMMKICVVGIWLVIAINMDWTRSSSLLKVDDLVINIDGY